MSNYNFTDIKNYYEKLYKDKEYDAFPFDYKRTYYIIKDIIENKDHELKSLDIGCGAGYACQILKEKEFKIYGIDISERALKIASKNIPDGIFKVANNSGTIEFNNDFFDIVICLGVLEHIINPETIVKETYRILKKNGTAIFLVPNSKSPYFYFSSGTGQILEIPRSNIEWKRMFENEGFNIISIKKDPGPTYNKNFTFIKKIKVLLQKIINLLPVSLTYQFIYTIQK